MGVARRPGGRDLGRALRTTDDEDLSRLREAVRGALQQPNGDVALAADAEWRDRWSVLVGLGLPALCVPGSLGGYGFEAEAAVVVAKELGAVLHGSPFAGLVASTLALARGDAAAGHDLVSEVVAGRRICAFGFLDASCELLGGTRVSGVARLVDGAQVADSWLLAVPSGSDLVLVDNSTGGRVEPPALPFDESRRYGDVVLDRAPVVAVTSSNTAPLLYRLLLAADALGGVERVLDRTVAYAGERRAFGHPIGGLQAVQHRLVEHTIGVRGMRLLATEAARQLAAGAPSAERQVALAEISVSSGAVHILHDLLQLTGAIGFTWEHGLHLYERRAHQDSHLVGNPRAAIRTLAANQGWLP